MTQGQFRLVLNSEPIVEIIQDSATDSTTAEKLRLISKIKSFSIDRLGLFPSDNYTRFVDTEGQPVLWNTSASLPHKFEPFLWTFPIAGTVPYKGYFTHSLAIAERDTLRARGFDAITRPVPAYSTLGFFSDPVLSTMLKYSDDELANLVIHELTHSTIYSPDNTNFNESLASFVGDVGSLLFMEHTWGKAHPIIATIRARRNDRERFRYFMKQVTEELDSLYSAETTKAHVLEKRKVIFASWQSRFSSRLKHFNNPDYYRGFLEWKVNNARLLSYRRYNSQQSVFSSLYRITGENFRDFLGLVKTCEKNSHPWSCVGDLVKGSRAINR